VREMVSHESLTYGEHEGSAYQGQFGDTCYHSCGLLDQPGDVERCALRCCRSGGSQLPALGEMLDEVSRELRKPDRPSRQAPVPALSDRGPRGSAPHFGASETDWRFTAAAHHVERHDSDEPSGQVPRPGARSRSPMRWPRASPAPRSTAIIGRLSRSTPSFK
jgi:hypothetical protein